MQSSPRLLTATMVSKRLYICLFVLECLLAAFGYACTRFSREPGHPSLYSSIHHKALPITAVGLIANNRPIHCTH